MNADDLLLSENGEPVRWCDCAELLVGEGKDRHRIPAPKYHSCSYVAARNAILPQAIKRANEVALRHGDDSPTARNAAFTRALSLEMERACAELLKQTNGQNA